MNVRLRMYKYCYSNLGAFMQRVYVQVEGVAVFPWLISFTDNTYFNNL